jgi:hypothetical protein
MRWRKMTMYEIRVIANKMGINPKKMNKMDLIRSIQIQEGNTPCFKTAGTYCDQTNCLWKSDCLK